VLMTRCYIQSLGRLFLEDPASWHQMKRPGCYRVHLNPSVNYLFLQNYIGCEWVTIPYKADS
jgi:hypothetical protein